MREMMTSIAQEAKKPPLQAGVECLTFREMQGIATSFGKHLRDGVEGRSSSLATIPTLLKPVSKDKLHAGQEAMIVEVGGSHIRGGLVRIDEDKNPQLISEKSFSFSDTNNKKYNSSDDFFDEVAQDVAPLLSGGRASAIGIIWSFPADVFVSENGVDAISTDKLTKELVIRGINTQPVGTMLVDGLQRNGIAIPSDIPRAVVNDTAAVLLANNGTLGGIVATGFNMAFTHMGQIYNMEAGGFSEVPQTELTRMVDRASERPDHFLAEKQISGEYVGKAFNLALKNIGISDREYNAEDMSAILSGLDTSPAQYDEIRAIAENLRDRSAQLVASMISGTIMAFPEDFSTNEIHIPMEGSFFGRTPGYMEAVSLYTSQLLPDKKIQFDFVNQSGMKGAALAALGLL